jgi:hypothetical protein
MSQPAVERLCAPRFFTASKHVDSISLPTIMGCSRPLILLSLILAVASPPVLTTGAAEEAGPECAWDNGADSRTNTETSTMSALVLGGTGAVGEWVAVQRQAVVTFTVLTKGVVGQNTPTAEGSLRVRCSASITEAYCCTLIGDATCISCSLFPMQLSSSWAAVEELNHTSSSR